MKLGDSLMFKIVKQIVFLFIVALLVISTSGFNLYSRYCDHHHAVEASVIVESHCCDEEVVDEPSCCAHHNHDDTDKNHEHDGDTDCEGCGDLKTTYLKTDVFQASEKPVLRIACLELLSTQLIYSDNPESNDICVHCFNLDLPPPDFGKTFLISTQQLKLDISDLV